MAASYPTSAKTFTTKASNDTIEAAHVNDLQAEVTAVEGGLLNGLAHDLKFTDDTYDIGKSGATRPRDLFLSRDLSVGGDASVGGDVTLGDSSADAITFSGSAVDLVNGICEGRLTLTSGTAVTTSDVTAATSVYFTPYKGNRLALYDGTHWKLYSFSELTLALGTLTDAKNYDVFVYDNSGTLTLEAVAWTSDSARATAITLQNGVYVKSGSTTKRYLGTFRTTSTTTTEDSLAKRFLWNYYNRVRRPMRVLEATNSWAYTTATWRQANNSTSNQLAAVIGVAEVSVDADLLVFARNTSAGVQLSVAIKEDSVTAPSHQWTSAFGVKNTAAASEISPLVARLNSLPAAGYHFWAWLEFSDATGTTTWFGDNNGNSVGPSSGIHGSLEG